VTSPTVSTDGRNLRRDRNREAVVGALLELWREGDLAPSADEIAARAGISARSLFRYFDDTDAMVRTAIERQQQHVAPLYALDTGPGDPFGDRVDRFVAARARLLDGMGHVGRVARAMAPRQPLVAAELARIRATLRAQVAELFSPELGDLAPGPGAAALAAADVVTSWEAWDLLRNDQGLDRDAAVAVVAATLHRLLGPAREAG
jgi:TetR/AcrR family transcriptional regulator, regulator of autoinduction and epiphytic fitness